MTRISGAQRGLNSFLDQIVNARSDAAAAAGSQTGGQTAGFDSHLAKLSPDGGAANAQSGDASSTAADGTATRQKDPANSVSALFAALTGDDENLTAAAQGGNADGQAAAQDAAAPPGSDSTDAASALFAALNGTGQSADSEAPTPSPLNQTPISNLLSLANMAASTVASTPASGSKSTDTTQNGSLALSRPQSAPSKPTASASSLTVKRLTDSLKRGDPTSMPSADLAASAQVTIAAVAASLTPQNPAVTQPARKDTASGAGSHVGALGGQTSGDPLSTGLSPSVLPSADTQSPSDAVEFPTQSASLDLFGESTKSDGSSSQSIKMTVSSIQAETHFAPVQQLSPTQQIVDFVALTAGAAPTTDASTATSTAATSASVPSTAASATTSLAASPVKMLTLALEPDALGTVTITMRLVNSNLDLKVEAEKSDTASLIEKDKDNLSDKLQSLGYSVDSMVVKIAMPQSSHLDPSNDQAATGQGQQAGSDASASSSSQNGGRNSNDQSPTQAGTQGGGGSPNQDPAAVASSSRTLTGDVYL